MPPDVAMEEWKSSSISQCSWTVGFLSLASSDTRRRSSLTWLSAWFGCESGCFTFQQLPQLQQLQIILHIDLVDGVQSVRKAHDQPFAEQTAQGHADWCPRHLQNFRKWSLLKHMTGAEFLRQDHCFELLIGLVRDGVRRTRLFFKTFLPGPSHDSSRSVGASCFAQPFRGLTARI